MKKKLALINLIGTILTVILYILPIPRTGCITTMETKGPIMKNNLYILLLLTIIVLITTVVNIYLIKSKKSSYSNIFLSFTTIVAILLLVILAPEIYYATFVYCRLN